MSILGKKWIIKNTNEALKTFEKILENRNLLNVQEISEFHDPFLFLDMKKAVERIKNAIETQERIIIFGDYDVDGITGTVILMNILKSLNANVSCRLPNRQKDGYGLSEKFIDEFIEKEIKIIITVDCGISCEKEIKKAKENGIDVILTDHHTVPKNIPKDALAIIHPKYDNNYPYKELTGAGVALKLAHALIKYFHKDKEKELLEPFIDLAALGTISDLGPLKDENRLIVKTGLKNLNNTKWVGLKEIMDLAAIKKEDKIDTTTVGFKIAPRINAAGRIGDPYLALSLLLQKFLSDKVKILGKKLEELNVERQKMTDEAITQVKKYFDQKDLSFILIAESPNWHVGILGLIAGKLAEKYSRPAIIMQDLGDILVGSARSIPNFNIIEALTNSGKYLISFGGHKEAAGFSLKKEHLENFKKELELYTKEKLQNLDLKSVMEIDCELTREEIDFNLIEKIEELEPFGVENRKPKFLMNNLSPLFIDTVGKEKNHLKFAVEIENKRIDVIAFNMGEHSDYLRKHESIDLVFELEKNNWNGKSSIKFKALDFRESKQ